VDDDPAICLVVSEALRRAGHEVRRPPERSPTAPACSEAFRPDILITDVKLPDGDGLDDVQAIIGRWPDMRVIILSAQNTLNTASARPSRAPAAGRALAGDAGDLSHHRAADATDLTVMITGESGTGKELVARALHDFGKRRAGPFVAINMAAIPRELIESELFGHEKGAFTGANRSASAGRFEQAEGGTLFLDEIGDMPMEAQTRLLRVLQQGEYTTVGGRTPIRRSMSASSPRPTRICASDPQGLFREDLYYRLNVVPIRLPPLRERPRTSCCWRATSSGGTDPAAGNPLGSRWQPDQGGEPARHQSQHAAQEAQRLRHRSVAFARSRGAAVAKLPQGALLATPLLYICNTPMIVSRRPIS
jgi:two-component system nitrogen regulation response regulator GlnG